jgi:hypothetical protein
MIIQVQSRINKIRAEVPKYPAILTKKDNTKYQVIRKKLVPLNGR